MRFGRFVPSKCRLPECIRMIFPVAVTLKRLAAPRCVFSFLVLATISPGLESELAEMVQACPPGVPAVGRAVPAPRFGANNVNRIFASIRGPNSTWAWSTMSFSRRFIFARPTSW